MFAALRANVFVSETVFMCLIIRDSRT